MNFSNGTILVAMGSGLSVDEVEGRLWLTVTISYRDMYNRSYLTTKQASILLSDGKSMIDALPAASLYTPYPYYVAPSVALAGGLLVSSTYLADNDTLYSLRNSSSSGWEFALYVQHDASKRFSGLKAEANSDAGRVNNAESNINFRLVVSYPATVMMAGGAVVQY